MISDVPIGVTLSGGIDSFSSSYRTKAIFKKINTYSIAFSSKGDESKYAKISSILSTSHNEFINNYQLKD